MKKNTSGLAVYSFPGEESFYRVYGEFKSIDKRDLGDSEGFVFSPFDEEQYPIVKIDGRSELVTKGTPFRCLQDLPELEDPPENTQFDKYQNTVEQIISRLQSGDLDKVVFSISSVEEHSVDDFEELLTKLRHYYPNAFVYYFYTSQTGLWIGASPELLLQSNGKKVETVALAGTLKDAPRMEDWGEKEIKEHRFVEVFLEDQFEQGTFIKKGPGPVIAGPVYHLSTHYEIAVKNFAISPFDIHPGPALSGYPVPEAIEVIEQLENRPRKYYSGFLGPVYGNNTFRFYINLRCMEVFQDYAVMYAGGGITGDSSPDKEWDELQYKFSTLRSKMLTAEQV